VNVQNDKNYDVESTQKLAPKLEISEFV